jgi:hypothetical protein
MTMQCSKMQGSPSVQIICPVDLKDIWRPQDYHIPAVKLIKVNSKQNAHICIEEHQGLNNLPVAILAGLHQSSLHINRNRYSLLAHFISEFGTENKQMHHKSSLPAPYNS